PLIPENLASWAPPATDEEAARVFIQRMLEL
ncbi:cupin fold metalloprotein, WbuC family, partial [Bacteroides fragilis]